MVRCQDATPSILAVLSRCSAFDYLPGRDNIPIWRTFAGHDGVSAHDPSRSRFDVYPCRLIKLESEDIPA